MRQMRTYNQIWKIPKMLYGVLDFTFPFPVSFRQLGIAAATFIVMVVLNKIPPLSLFDLWFTKFFIIPIASAWFFTKYQLDGKSPHKFVMRWLVFKLSHHRFNRYKHVHIGKKHQYGSKVFFQGGKPKP
ncbi:TcpE family conjugal transfer membrane protein [Paenibacillus alvei]|nr:TcpE family conjugal transfer membrane protein [Paenibacillus alvei]